MTMKPPTGSVGADELAANLKSFTTDVFTANGSTAAFTLSETPPNANSVLVFVDGILQKASTNYSISGTTLTFTSNPDNNSEIEAKHMGIRGVVRRSTDFIYDSFTGDGSDTTFTLSNNGATTNSAFVFYNGIALKPTTDYAISGTTSNNNICTSRKFRNNGEVSNLMPSNSKNIAESQIYDVNSTATGAFDLPSGTTAQRPGSPNSGQARFNSTIGSLEFYDGIGWVQTNLTPTINSITGNINNGYGSNFDFKRI